MTARILFVASADSPHAQGWVSLLRGSDFDVRLFSIPLQAAPPHVPDWNYPTYVSVPPAAGSRRGEIRSLLPVLPYTRSLVTWIDDRFSVSARWLRRVIRDWRPQIVHSLPLDPAGKLARAAIECVPERRRPRWVASAWGSDLAIGLLDPKRRPNIDFILRHCDGFMADCRHDLQLAEHAGLAPGKRALADAVPGNGGIDLHRFAAIRAASATRRAIVIPKAFEREHANRTYTVIEALRLVGPEVLKGFEIHLVMCSPGVRTWLAQMPEWLREQSTCHATLPQDRFFELLGRARVLAAPSLSDGTPNVMLEAMAAGALPVMSPLPSTAEWISDGANGLTAHALYPDRIAAALQRAVTDDVLFARASRENWDLIRARADRRAVAAQVIDYYRGLAS